MPNYYHYTDDEGAKLIIRSGTIQASLNGDEHRLHDTAYGNGVYLTTLSPYTSSKDEIAKNNWSSISSAAKKKLKNYFIINIPESEIKNTNAVDRNIFIFGYGNDIRLYKYCWVLKDYDSGRTIASYKYRLSLSGPAAKRHSDRIGDYVMIDNIVNGRPVYKNNSNNYLYAGSRGQWFIGNDRKSIGKDAGCLGQKSKFSLGPDQNVPWEEAPNGWSIDHTIAVKPFGNFLFSFDDV